MLRTAISSKSYDVTVTIAGEQTKMVFRSLTLMERLKFMDSVATSSVSAESLDVLATNLEQLIISIDGYDEKPSEVICRMEHKADIDALLESVVKWCHLDEQEAKNLDSLPAQLSPAQVRANAENTAGAESGPVSTNETDSTQTAP